MWPRGLLGEKVKSSVVSCLVSFGCGACLRFFLLVWLAIILIIKVSDFGDYHGKK